MASNDPYTSRGVCSIQINRLACDGTPLTVADGDTNVIMLAGAGDATEVELGKIYETVASQSDGVCWSAPASKSKTGDEAVLRHCSTTYLDLITTLGNDEPVFDLAGNTCGHASPKNGEGSECCYCNESACEDGEDFSIMFWSCMLDCDNEPIRDEEGNVIYEVCVLPRISDVTPAQRRRKSSTPSNNRVDYNFTLEANSNYGFGPGDAFIGEAFYDVNGEVICSAAVNFQTTIAPPTAGCPCESEVQGKFLTAALSAASGVVPVGG